MITKTVKSFAALLIAAVAAIINPQPTLKKYSA